MLVVTIGDDFSNKGPIRDVWKRGLPGRTERGIIKCCKNGKTGEYAPEPDGKARVLG